MITLAISIAIGLATALAVALILAYLLGLWYMTGRNWSEIQAILRRGGMQPGYWDKWPDTRMEKLRAIYKARKVWQ